MFGFNLTAKCCIGLMVCIIAGAPKLDTIKPEPLSKLYEVADFVGIVQVVSGAYKEYAGAIYKMKIVISFKGEAAEQILYVGPFSGYGIGKEYLLLGKKTGRRLKQQWGESNNQSSLLSDYDREVEYLTVMQDGLGMLPITYIVEANNKAVEIPNQILLPRQLVSKQVKAEGKSWLSKDALANYLNTLKK